VVDVCILGIFKQGTSWAVTIKIVIKNKQLKQARPQMSYLQSVSEIKCSNTVIVMTRFLIKAFEILMAWTNLLPPVNSGWKSALDASHGL